MNDLSIRQMIGMGLVRAGKIIGGLGKKSDSALVFRNPFSCEHIRNNRVIGVHHGWNDVTIVGKNLLLDTMFGNSTPVSQIDPWYIGVIAFAGLWNFGFQDYQKNRIKNFINPLADIRGTGYNAYQSTIAVGSGQWLGKGVGYGTQSRLRFLPEFQTDFIFAAFAEEWGYVGVLLLFTMFSILIFRIVTIAMHGATNFEILFGLGVAILFIVHILINIGMNIGVLPVTGTALPFLSYGGTHVLTEFIALGILMGMKKYSRIAHKDTMKHEFLGPQ